MDEQTYRKLFDTLEPSPQHVEALCQMATQRQRKPRRHWWRQIAAATVVLCLLVSFGTSMALVETVDPSKVALEQWDYSALAEPVGVSDSSLGWTITVDGTVCGSWYTYLLCTLSKDSGGKLQPGEFGFHEWSFDFQEDGGKSTVIQWLTDSEPEDNRIPFCVSIQNNGQWSMNGQRLHMRLEGLLTASFAESLALLAAGGGKWELTFDLPAAGPPEQSLAAPVEVLLNGKPAVLAEARCAPMKIFARFTSEAGAFQILNPTMADLSEEVYPLFVLADGTVLDMGGGGGSGDGTEWRSSYSLHDGALLSAPVVALQIGDAVYPLEWE